MTKPHPRPANRPQRLKRVPCPHWQECGGCPYIRYDYHDQLRVKNDRVLAIFHDAGFQDSLLRRIFKPAQPALLTLGYRNKAKWILQHDTHGQLKMGIYAPDTHDVVDIPRCAVHAPLINEVSLFVKKELLKHEVPCGNEFLPAPTVRYIIVRYSFLEKRTLLVFVTSGPKVLGLENVFKAVDLRFGDQVLAIVQNINADDTNVLLGEANRFFKRKKELTELLGPFRVPVGPLSFIQVNSRQAGVLYRKVVKLLGSGPHQSGVDLYSGVGLMALHLAKGTKRVLSVEESGPAVLEAITSARRNRARNILHFCGDAKDGLQAFVSEWGAPDWLILNPPRKGCERAVLESIVIKAPGRVVYVSCNPVTLARDLLVLLKEYPDFELASLEPVDMFPQTEHIECIALLANRNFQKGRADRPLKKPKSKTQLPEGALH